MRSTLKSFGCAIALIASALAASAGGCDGGRGDAGGAGTGAGEEIGCPDDAQFFQDSVYAPILSQKCAVCHSEGGLAGKSRFVLEQGDSPEIRQTNFETVRDVARTDVGGKSILLLRPTGMHP